MIKKNARFNLVFGISYLFLSLITTQFGYAQREAPASRGENFAREEAENISAEYVNNMGGDLSKRVVATNPDLFPPSLSPLEKMRRLTFYVARADRNGHIDQGQTLKAWQQIQERKARQLGKSFSLSDPIRGSIASPTPTLSQSPEGATSPQSFINWTNIGPVNATYSGRIGVGAIAPDPTNPNIVYVGGATGGVWKTTNGGTSWVPLTDNLPTQGCGALAVDPNNSNIVYCGTGDIMFGAYGTGIYKSTDAGQSWALSTPLNGFIIRIVIDPTNSQRIFAASYFYVLRSLDGGATWAKVFDKFNQGGNSTGQIWDVAINPANPNVVFTTVSAQATDAGIYKSTDGGTTWYKVTSGLPSPDQIWRAQIAISRSSPNVVVALIANTNGNLVGLYKSTDSGETWSKTSLAFT